MNLPEVAAPIDVAVVLAGGGVILIVISLPMWHGWIRRNWIYGARTSISMPPMRTGRSSIDVRVERGSRPDRRLSAWRRCCGLALPRGWSEDSYKAVMVLDILGALAWILRELFAAEEQTPRPRVKRWPRGSGGPPRSDESDHER